jgi:hypothetical protein
VAETTVKGGFRRTGRQWDKRINVCGGYVEN